MDSILEDKLKQLEITYQQLTDKMSDPNILTDYEQIKNIAKSRKEIEISVNKYRAYKKNEAEMLANRELIKIEQDPEMLEFAKEEIVSLESKLNLLEEDLQLSLLPQDPNDDKNVILEIRAGTGGDEASLFAGDLMRMY